MRCRVWPGADSRWCAGQRGASARAVRDFRRKGAPAGLLVDRAPRRLRRRRFEFEDALAASTPAACAWGQAREGGVVFVDCFPVVPGFEEVVALGGGLEDVGEFFDESAEVGGGGVEEGEKGVDEGGGGDAVGAVGGDGVAEGGEFGG